MSLFVNSSLDIGLQNIFLSFKKNQEVIMKVAVCIFGVLVVLVIVISSNSVRNSIGSMLGYGGCPNCGSSWLYAKPDTITYEKLKEGKDFFMTGNACDHMHVIATNSGVMICKTCLQNPSKLNVDRIANDLRKCGWESEKVELVKLAIIAYKKSAIEKKDKM